jgi:predicted ArsR family transcriptional regulator
MSVSPEPATRSALLQRLKLNGPLTAQALAGALGVTAMAVRQHLYALMDEGLIAWTTEGSGRGRPSKLWALTAQAGRLFPDAHQELAVGLLTAVREALGEAGFEKVLAQRGADQTRLYRQAMPGDDLSARVEALAAIRSREGYMAEARPDGEGGYLLIENHCPVCAAASACTGICASELMVFRAVLGPGADIERTDHILAGARRCAYRIRPEGTA